MNFLKGMMTGATASIFGGAGAGATMGGIGGMMSGDEGAVGKGIVGGFIAGGLAGAGASSLMTSGGMLNRAAMSVGGIADDMLGNTSNKAYFKALRSNADISGKIDDSATKQAYNAAQKEYDEAFSHYEKGNNAYNRYIVDGAYEVDKSGNKVRSKDFKKLQKTARKQYGVKKDEPLSFEQMRETYLRREFAKTEDISSLNADGVEMVEEGGKSLLERVATTKEAYKAERAGYKETMARNQKIIDKGASGSGSAADFFEGLGDSQVRAQSNIGEYQKLSKKSADGSIEDAELGRMMNLESELGEVLTGSINKNRKAGYNMHKDPKYQEAFSDYAGRVQGNVSDRNRAATFAGAGLTGIMVGSQMGNRRKHKRGMNAKRGARF